VGSIDIFAIMVDSIPYEMTSHPPITDVEPTQNEESKSVHILVLDAGPILKNEPSVSSLLQKATNLITVPSVIAEIRDPAARSRVETTLLPFLTIRSPKPQSIKVISDFARRTGDLAVLSGPDLQILALAYELECERNGGDWRLRKTPGQKGMNGSPPKRGEDSTKNGLESAQVEAIPVASTPEEATPVDHTTIKNAWTGEVTNITPTTIINNIPELSSQLEKVDLTETSDIARQAAETEERQPEEAQEEDDDSDGWITPSNVKKHKAKDDNPSSKPSSTPKTFQVATLTTDFAMQNVLLQMNLNLLSTTLSQISHIKSWVLRCHACFKVTKDMTKQFCPSCGGSTLMRASCSTNSNGEFKVHLKKTMQWNNRGNVFSIPKAVSGSSSGKLNIGGGGKGGGKGGWGQELILREDQKEYTQSMMNENRRKERDLMDMDYLPGILTGERGKHGGRPRVGAGRNVNAKKRH
jgi:RNA-binding protein NOB1